MRKIVLIVVLGAILFMQLSLLAGGEEKLTEKKEEKKQWTDNVIIKGDFRYRHETILEENSPERNRERFRMRIGADAKISDDFKAVFRLASGGDDPVSTNQTLGSSFTSKTIMIDLAYFEWKPTNMKGFCATGGKVKNPFETPGKSDLIWDGDLTLEGMTASYTFSDSSIAPFVNAGGFWVEERGSAPDSGLLGAQVGLNIAFSKETKLKLGVGYFDYQHTKGYRAFYGGTTAPFKGFGNSLDAGGNYLNDYDETEVFSEFSFKAGGLPISIFADFVNNADADKNNNGYFIGFSLGKDKEAGDWLIRYDYRKLERDAVIGAFTDSDCWGGGTNGKGHRISFSVVVAKNTMLGVTAFFDKKDIISNTDYKRFQFDISFKF
jgi:hypothetical protein